MEVTVENITHHFNDKAVLSNISYSFNENRITAILGKSGSGKTTLLQILNGMIKPDAGTITISNQSLDYNALPEVRTKMGYVIQQAGLFPHLSVKENISILGKVSKQPDEYISARLNQLICLVQLPLSYLEKYPHELSGGEQQRVGLCRAMFLDPPVLLMDEPFASLDFETKQGIYQHLLNIQKAGPRTIILVTHDWDEAVKLSDHFIWLEGGKIKAHGDRAGLLIAKASYFEQA
jgi:osmoprotectant transport system ATP-binding protein